MPRCSICRALKNGALEAGKTLRGLADQVACAPHEATENLQGMWPAFLLAQKVGAQLGRGALLL